MSHELDETFGCLLATGRTDRDGYSFHGSTRAHIVAWTRVHGPVPEGLVLDHLCRRRHCCAPHHLEAVTQAENLLRKAWRYRAKRTHCIRGHVLASNRAVTPEGGIVCRQCNRDAERGGEPDRHKVCKGCGDREALVIAALYVAAGGCYFGLEGVDPWDEQRDARTYAGPWPVVAHPPCQLWVNFAALNYKRYGGEHNRPGNDGGCFASALAAVRKWGGVIEHPASSRAWAAHGLPRPSRAGGWLAAAAGEWVCEVWQSAYGHRARKRTWLLYRGAASPPDLSWEHKAGEAQVGWFDRNRPSLSKCEASATPPAFRDALLSLARASRGARAQNPGGG